MNAFANEVLNLLRERDVSISSTLIVPDLYLRDAGLRGRERCGPCSSRNRPGPGRTLRSFLSTQRALTYQKRSMGPLRIALTLLETGI